MPGGKAPGGFGYGKIPTKKELKGGVKALAQREKEAAKKAKEVREGKMPEEEPSKGKTGGERKEVPVKGAGSKPAGAAGRRLPTNKRRAAQPEPRKKEPDVVIEDAPEDEVFPSQDFNTPEPQPFYDPQQDPAQYAPNIPQQQDQTTDNFWQQPQPQSPLLREILDRVQNLRPSPQQQQPSQPAMQPGMGEGLGGNQNPFLADIIERMNGLRPTQPNNNFQRPDQPAANIPMPPAPEGPQNYRIPPDPVRHVGATGQANMQEIPEAEESFLYGRPDQNLQLPKFTPQQADIMNLLLAQGSQNFNPDYLSQRAREQYTGQTAPGLADRFSQFGKNSPTTNSFGTGIAGTGDLEERLGALRARIGQSQLGMGLKPSYENIYLPGGGNGNGLSNDLFQGKPVTAANIYKGLTGFNFPFTNNQGADVDPTTTPQQSWWDWAKERGLDIAKIGGATGLGYLAGGPIGGTVAGLGAGADYFRRQMRK